MLETKFGRLRVTYSQTNKEEGDKMASDIIRRPQSTGSNGGDMSAYKYCREREGIVHLDVIVDGKRFRRSTGRPATPANLKYVDKNWQSEVDRILNKNKIEEVNDGEITVKEYGYKSLDANRGMRKENTHKDYVGTFEARIIPIFGGFALSKILTTDLKSWQSKLLEEGLSGSRIRNIRNVLRGIMQDAMDDDLISKNPFDNLKGVSVKAKVPKHPFTLDEVKYILENETGWFKNFLTVAFFTGMRTGELMALRWSDVSLTSEKIKVRISMRKGVLGTTKTDASQDREIDILPPVLEALKEQFKMTGLGGGTIFISNRGSGFTDTSGILKTHWYPLLKRLSLVKRDLYHTRHTFATMMISRNEDITWVSKTLGHADVNITLSTYTKFVENNSVKRASFLDQVDVYKQKDLSRDCHVSVTLEKSMVDLKLA